MVQQEDGGPWTHGTIVGTGDHNHNYCSYTIQLTTNGRRITCNRQHIKLTSVTADAYIQYQVTKHIHKQNDLLEDILECIRNNPMAYVMPKQNNSNNIQKPNDEQQANNGQQGRRQDPKQKTMNIKTAQFFSSPSDLMKSTVMDESLSTTSTRVLFQRRVYLLLNDTTE